MIRKRPTLSFLSFFLFPISLYHFPLSKRSILRKIIDLNMKRKKEKYRSSSRGFRSLGYSKPYSHFYEKIIDRIIRNSQRIGILFVGIFHSLLLVRTTPFRTELRSINIQKSSRKIDRSSWTFCQTALCLYFIGQPSQCRQFYHLSMKFHAFNCIHIYRELE